MSLVQVVITFLAVCGLTAGLSSNEAYYGSRIGKISTHFHDVRGDVYAVDERTIFLKNFNYDGKGSDAFFWAGSSVRPDGSGFAIPDEKGNLENLRAYLNEDIVLRLPQDKRVKDLRWLAVWSRRFGANFGSLIFPRGLQLPQPAAIGHLDNTQRGVTSGNIYILDTQTFLVEDFSYDGSAENAYWWLSRGMKPNTGGIQLLDENQSDNPLRKYSKETVLVSVPEGHSIFDYDTLSVWSKTDIMDFGIVKIPKDIRVPPSPRALGIVPENKLNCEMLNDNLGFEARWVIEDDQLIMQLIGNIDVNEYMALGFSKDDAETKFSSADAVIAWVSPDGQGHAVDYFLQNTEKCENGQGMCPDTTRSGSHNSITLLNAAKMKDAVTVTFKRSLKAVDEEFDQNIYTDGPQAVLWAVGPIMEDGQPGPPKLRTRGNLLLDFGRQPLWNCPLPVESVEEIPNDIIVPKPVAKVHCPTDLTFRAQLGPSRAAGRPDRIWYINGLPSPDLTVQKGHTYTFIVEGGDSPPSHHPLYITSSEAGGLYQKLLEANEDGEVVYAGVTTDPGTGALLPTAEGRLCEWTWSGKNGDDIVVETSDMETDSPLQLNCASGDAGILTWSADANSSDSVYYQSFIQKNLGGRINVVDFCEETNPDHYLEEAQRRKDSHTKVKVNAVSQKESELEREGDVEIIQVPGSSAENQEASSSKTANYIRKPDVDDVTKSGGKKTEERITSPFLSMNDTNEPNKGNDATRNDEEPTEQILPPLESNTPTYQHDQSERSDANILDFSDTVLAKHELKRPPVLGHNRRQNAGNFPDLETRGSNTPPGFNVQFEGGFVPLVYNSLKEKESTIHPDYISPPPRLRRPPRPFLFNESIPFHGTFKPGIPDFSGFNISHYTQDGMAIEPNHLADHIALLSAPKPQIIQKVVLPPPMELFRRPHNGPKPPILKYGPRPQMMHLPGHQQPLFFQMSSKPQPNFLMPQSSEEEDLDEVSSQRVQISLQTPNEKNRMKEVSPSIPQRQQENRKRPQGYGPPPLIPPPVPAIQRRPDVLDDENPNFQQARPQKPSQRKPDNDKPQQFRPPHLRGPMTGRPQPFKLLATNGGIPNTRPFSVPKRRLPDSAAQIPELHIQRPVRPHQQDTLQDNPFVYRIPNRQNMNVLKQHMQTLRNILPPRFAPPPIRPVAPENIEILSDSLPPEILDDGLVSYEILPQEENLKPHFLNLNTMPPNFENLRPHSPIFNGPLPHPDVRPKFNPNIEALQAPKPNEAVILDEQQRQPVKPYIHNQPIFPEGLLPNMKFETEKGKTSVDTTFVLPDKNPIFDNREMMLLQNAPSNSEIISIEKKESQEIHLPPLQIPTSIENIQHILKHADNVKVLENIDNKQPPSTIHHTEYEDKKQEIVAGHILPHNVMVKPPEQEHPPRNENKNNLKGENSNSEIKVENVPFGARLKVRPVEQIVRNVNPVFHPPQRPTLKPSRRQPQFHPQHIDMRFQITTRKPDIPQIDPANLYFRPPGFIIKDSTPKDMKNKEKPAVPPKATEKLHLSTYTGRKNLLPTDINRPSNISIPPRAPENIRLPEISEKPVPNDNGTDYSILSHVLSLIGGHHQTTKLVLPKI